MSSTYDISFGGHTISVYARDDEFPWIDPDDANRVLTRRLTQAVAELRIRGRLKQMVADGLMTDSAAAEMVAVWLEHESAT